jgi:hypothetical protein
MASKGLQVIFYQDKRNIYAEKKPAHTAETLIGYIVC